MWFGFLCAEEFFPHRNSPPVNRVIGGRCGIERVQYVRKWCRAFRYGRRNTNDNRTRQSDTQGTDVNVGTVNEQIWCCCSITTGADVSTVTRKREFQFMSISEGKIIFYRNGSFKLVPAELSHQNVQSLWQIKIKIIQGNK